jgi:hypothetical protein
MPLKITRHADCVGEMVFTSATLRFPLIALDRGLRWSFYGHDDRALTTQG